MWLFLAVEQLPLAAEESVDPSRDMPRGIVAAFYVLLLRRLTLSLNPSVAPGSFKLSVSGEPLLDGFRATFGEGPAKTLALVACVGLISPPSTPSCSPRGGRSIRCRAPATSRAFCRSPIRATRHPMSPCWRARRWRWRSCSCCGSAWAPRKAPSPSRPYRSPLGIAGAIVTLVIAAITLAFQLVDPMFATGVFWVGVWFTLGIIWFALVGQNRLVLAPEEAFAIGASEPD